MAALLWELQAPLRDRRGRISLLKAGTFAFIVVVPAFAMLWPFATDSMGGDPSIPLTYTTGTWACWFLALSLAVTPARRIFGLTELIAVRRMLGIAAVACTLAHCIVFFWLIHFDRKTFNTELTRPTIWIATMATVGLFVLAATSLDSAIAKMGVWWNRLHNATYILTALALTHYLLSRASTAGLPFLLAGVFFWLMAWRVLDRFRKGASLPWLFALGAGVTAFTLGFETVWLYLYRGRDVWKTFTGEFVFYSDFYTAVPATMMLAFVVLAIPLLAAALGRPMGRLPVRRAVPRRALGMPVPEGASAGHQRAAEPVASR